MGTAENPGGSRNTSSRFMLQKPEISAGLVGLSRLVTETFLYHSNSDLFTCEDNRELKQRQRRPQRERFILIPSFFFLACAEKPNLACLLGRYSPSFPENLGFLAFMTPT